MRIILCHTCNFPSHTYRFPNPEGIGKANSLGISPPTSHLSITPLTSQFSHLTSQTPPHGRFGGAAHRPFSAGLPPARPHLSAKVSNLLSIRTSKYAATAIGKLTSLKYCNTVSSHILPLCVYRGVWRRDTSISSSA